jgi:hypothetical protein
MDINKTTIQCIKERKISLSEQYELNGMIISPTGKREILKQCSISRPEYIVVSQNEGCWEKGKLLYLFASDIEKLKKCQNES